MRISSIALSALSILVATGCKDVRIASGFDDRFIHLPSELSASPPPPGKSLFPTAPGSRWTYRLSGGETGIQVDTLLPPRIVQGQPTTVIGSTRKGTPPREELFMVTNQEISQISAGAIERVTMKPRMPILRFPLSYEETYDWQGGVSLQGALVPSQAKSRLRCTETVQVPAGKFQAYRVDTVLSTRLTEGQARFWTTRWLAAGVGIVKMRYIIQAPGQSERVYIKELLSYQL